MTVAKATEDVRKSAAAGNIPPEQAQMNRRLVEHIREWYATPDDKGEAWWDELEREVLGQRLRLRRGEG